MVAAVALTRRTANSLGALIEKDEKMQCDEAQALISARSDAKVSEATPADLRQHLAACPACAGVQAYSAGRATTQERRARDSAGAARNKRVRMALAQAAAPRRARLCSRQAMGSQLPRRRRSFF